jgi:antitoxin HicB
VRQEIHIVYPARLTREPEGGFVVRFRDLPDCLTQGDDEAEALFQAADALAEALAARINHGEPIPAPSAPKRGERLISPEEPLGLKTALYELARAEGLGKSALARRLGVDEKEVRRLLDPRHPTQESRLRAMLAKLGVATRSVVIDSARAAASSAWGERYCRQTRSSTTAGSASVEVSPRLEGSSSAILRRMRRMILPERVFGRPGANWMRSGEAIGPMSLRTQATSSLRSASVGSVPFISVT